jgi:iron complex outermembrane recepter protein
MALAKTLKKHSITKDISFKPCVEWGADLWEESTMKKTTLITSAAVIALATAYMPAYAQEDTTTGGGELRQDKITITARKKEEGLLEAPIAVSAFDAASIEQLQLQSVDDVARFTPGLSFSKAFGRSTERPVIRGQSNVLAGVQFGVESGTAYFVDGVYYAGSIQNLDPNDLQQVEVIKGPQSALYGRNTYAGAINFTTKGGTEEFEAGGKYRFGNNDSHEASGFISGPLFPGLTGRASVRFYDYGGEFTNTVTDKLVGSEETFSISGVLDFAPHADFDARLRVQRNEDKDGPLPIFLQDASQNNCAPGYRSLSSWRIVPGFGGVPFPRSFSTNTNQYYCGVIAPQPVALNTDADADGIPNLIPGIPEGSSFIQPVYSLADGTAFDGIKRDQTIVSLTSDWNVGGSGYHIRGLAGYRDEQEFQGYDSDHSSVNWFVGGPGSEAFFANTTRDDVEDYSFEVRLESPDESALRWLVGLYYYNQDVLDSEITFADPTGANTPTGTRTIENQAIFGLVEYDFTDKVSVTLEGRYAEEVKTDSTSPIDEASFNKFTPRITLDYNLDNGGTLYAIYAQGVKPGGLNGAVGAAVNQPTYKQEESDNFELGIKTPVSMLPGAFNFTGSAYFTKATDVQLTTAIGTPSGALTSIATNQGAGEVLGIELDLSGAFNENWSTGVTYAWTDTEFTEGCDADEWTLTSGGGIYDNATNTGFDFTSAFPGSGPASCDISGNKFPLTSEHQASLFLRYDLANSGPFGSDFFASSDVTYESSKFVQVHNRAETGDATVLGARAGFETEGWTFSLYGQNLTDEDSIAMATRWLQTPYIFAGLNVAPTGASKSAPRAYFGSLRRGPSYGAELKFRF